MKPIPYNVVVGANVDVEGLVVVNCLHTVGEIQFISKGYVYDPLLRECDDDVKAMLSDATQRVDEIVGRYGYMLQGGSVDDTR
jgi:hypothetical protein